MNVEDETVFFPLHHRYHELTNIGTVGLLVSCEIFKKCCLRYSFSRSERPFSWVVSGLELWSQV